jgi:hypothetical protein
MTQNVFFGNFMTFASVSIAMKADKQLTFLNNLDTFIVQLKHIIVEDPKGFFNTFLKSDLEATPGTKYMNLVYQEFLEQIPDGRITWRGDDLSKVSLADLQLIFSDHATISGAYIDKTSIGIDHVDRSLSTTLVEQLNGKTVTINDVTYILKLSCDDPDEVSDLSDSEDELVKSPSKTGIVPLEERKDLILVNLPEDVPLMIVNNTLNKEFSKYGPIHRITIEPRNRSVKITFKKACHAREALKKMLKTIITFRTDSTKFEYVVRGYLSLFNSLKEDADLSELSDIEDSEIDEPVKSSKKSIEQRTVTLKNLPSAVPDNVIVAKLTKKFNKFGSVDRVIKLPKLRTVRIIFKDNSKIEKIVEALRGEVIRFFIKPGRESRYIIQFSSCNRYISDSDPSEVSDASNSDTDEAPAVKRSDLNEQRVLVFENLPKRITRGVILTPLLKEAHKYGAISRINPLLNERKVEMIYNDYRDAEDAFEDLQGKLIVFKILDSTTRDGRILEARYIARVKLIDLNDPKRERKAEACENSEDSEDSDE